MALKRVVLIAVCVILTSAIVLSLFMPLPKNAKAAKEEYVCTWDDGSVTLESFSSAYPDIISTSDCVLLSRSGLNGFIPFSPQFLSVSSIIRAGGLAELLSLRTRGINRLERLSLYRETYNCIWYGGGYFVWGVRGLHEVDSATGDTFILLFGSVSSSVLQAAGTKSLELRAGAEINGKTLCGTAVEHVTAYAPYSAAGGAIYADTTARRLVAALPSLKELTVSGCDYADEGALLACASLERLTLPFAGSAPSSAGNYFRGELAHLFSDGIEYHVPETLKEVTVTGGVLVSHAFYRCTSVEHVDLCGMCAEDVHPDALVDCTSLQTVHSPDSSLHLSGDFSSCVLPCGCTLFTRVGTE